MDRSSRAQTAIFILGMHRSGTSALAGTLAEYGIDLGPRLGGSAPDNARGHFEHIDIVREHEHLLATLRSAWNDPCSLERDWHRDARVGPHRERLRSIVRRDFFTSPIWGLKDPRLCRLLPLWIDILGELGVEMKVITIVRHPSAVCASLAKRDHLSVEHATMLWISHVLHAEQYSRSLPRTICLYEDLIADPIGEARRLAAFCFGGQPHELHGIPDANALPSADLQHHTDQHFAPTTIPQNRCVRDLYEALVAWRHEGTAPNDACARAGDLLNLAQLAAIPVADYIRLHAGNSLRSAQAALQQQIRANQLLEARFLVESGSRIASHGGSPIAAGQAVARH